MHVEYGKNYLLSNSMKRKTLDIVIALCSSFFSKFEVNELTNRDMIFFLMFKTQI